MLRVCVCVLTVGPYICDVLPCWRIINDDDDDKNRVVVETLEMFNV